MTNRTTQRHPIAAIALVLAVLLQTAVAGEKQWVRIQHPSDVLASQARTASLDLEDYGSFQWGRLDASEIEQLRQAGLSLTVEERPFELTLGGRTFDPKTDFPASRLFDSERSRDEKDFRLVQFNGPIRNDWLDRLRRTGLEPIQYVHPYAYIVWGDLSQLESTSRQPAVRWAGEFLPAFRLAASPHSPSASSESIEPTAISFNAQLDPSRLERRVREAGGELLRVTQYTANLSIASVALPRNRYATLAELAGVYSVQAVTAVAPRDEMSNQTIVGSFPSNQSVVPGYGNWLSSVGYDGSGVTVSIIDGGIRSTHVDLIDNMGACVSAGTTTSCTTANNAHGTHVAGAVAGSGASGSIDAEGFLQGQGVAPSATIIQQRYNSSGLAYNWGAQCTSTDDSFCLSPDGMLILFKEAQLSGASLANNSWGSPGFGNGYDLPTQQLDVVTRDANPDLSGNQPVLPVWAVQNGGGDGGGCGNASMGSPEEAKNALAVGASQLRPGTTSSGTVPDPSNTFGIGPNSAHGPACDGRLVPHIVAPGCFTQSTSSSSDTAYANSCGTSMATPVTSGAIAVFFEYFRDQFGLDPSPALTKAAFTAAAVNSEGNPNADGVTMGHRPDRFQGFGRLDLNAVVNPAHSVFYFDQEQILSATGDTWSIDLVAQDPAEPIQLVLAWTDAHGPGLGGTSQAWVNNLDLSVIAGGSVYAGNAVGSDGWSEAGGAFDEKNNLEGVFLNSSQHQGAISISVIAANLAADALNPRNPGLPQQDFALTCYNCIVGDPTFTIAPVPEALEACIPTAGNDAVDVDVAIGTLGAYSGSIDLSASGEPAGVSSSFAPNSVAAPGSSVWSLDISNSAQPGDATLTLQGDDGTDQHTAELALSLDDALLAAPTPQSPSDAAADQPLRPTLEWSTLAGATDYRVQIATDSGFGNVVIDETVASNTFSPASDLDLGTQYFWRVQGSNICGGGPWSAARSLTTRLQPEAAFSQTVFAFSLAPDTTAEATLNIANTGTGDLLWDVAADSTPAASRGTYDPTRDETLVIADFPLPANGQHAASVAGGVTTDGSVVGFTFEGTVSDISGTSTYASDMAMTITPPAGPSYIVGGFSESNDDDWAFQGLQSDNDGTYSSTHLGAGIFGPEGIEDKGSWAFDFEHTYQADMRWADVTITLHKVAPPACQAPLADPTWLSAAPAVGTIGAGLSEDLTISVDSTGMPEGSYVGYLCISTNDPNAQLTAIEVELEVTLAIFGDRFQPPGG